jgi:hypothetical protein
MLHCKLLLVLEENHLCIAMHKIQQKNKKAKLKYKMLILQVFGNMASKPLSGKNCLHSKTVRITKSAQRCSIFQPG